MRRVIANLLLVAAAGVALAACDRPAAKPTPHEEASAMRGAQLIADKGCGLCHRIPGIDNANGDAGPPLDRIARRTFIACRLCNTPDNMVAWLRDPQAVVPGNAMPNLDLEPKQARDIAAYLGTLQ